MWSKRRGAVLALLVASVTTVVAPLDAGAKRSGSGLPPACHSLAMDNPHVRALPGSAPSLAGYTVFSRSQTSQDIPPFALANNTGQLASYDPGATRLAQVSGPRRLYLLRGHRIHLRVSASCLAHFPPRGRAGLRLLARENAGQAGVCVLQQTTGAGSATQSQLLDTSCLSPSLFSSGLDFVGLNGGGSKMMLAEVVPDRVATVEMRYSSGAVSRGTVTGNLATLAAPSPVERRLRNPGRITNARRARQLVLATIPLAVIWRDAQGRVVRSFPRTAALVSDEVSAFVFASQLLNSSTTTHRTTAR